MDGITTGQIRHHQKASEVYVSVTFKYPAHTLNWDIPIEYRRTGTHLLEGGAAAIDEYLGKIYTECSPERWQEWSKEQEAFWATKANAKTTKPFFDVLKAKFEWKSIETDFPKNPNWARRIQDIKEFGYTLATDTNRLDKNTGSKCTHILLLPIARGGITGYEVWTKELRERIVALLGSYDAFEGKPGRKEGLLPDHKFPEIRWDENTKRNDLSSLSPADIKRDFQLLSNQRNQQKREVCRTCYQTDRRGIAYGIAFFYEGSADWDKRIPKRGKDAESGCVGCVWYDFARWRSSLNSKL
jgi:hypothetical protein